MGRFQLETAMPTLHEAQFGEAGEERSFDGIPVFTEDSYIVGVSGARGSGKSETLAYIGALALVNRQNVWSNFPIKFKLLRYDTGPEIVESEKLNFDDLFNLSDTIRGGWIIIDEYQDWANAYAFMTTQNKLLDSVWAQIRKLELSFAYGSKKLRWVDVKTREETDIEIVCKDCSKMPDYRYVYRPGQQVFWDVRDLSGNWTGKMYEDTFEQYTQVFEASFLWGAYDTKQRFDIFEAMRGVKLDLQKNVISDKNEQFNVELEEMKVRALARESTKWRVSEFNNALGLKNTAEKNRIARLIKDIGGLRKVMDGGYSYYLLDKLVVD